MAGMGFGCCLGDQAGPLIQVLNAAVLECGCMAQSSHQGDEDQRHDQHPDREPAQQAGPDVGHPQAGNQKHQRCQQQAPAAGEGPQAKGGARQGQQHRSEPAQPRWRTIGARLQDDLHRDRHQEKEEILEPDEGNEGGVGPPKPGHPIDIVAPAAIQGATDHPHQHIAQAEQSKQQGEHRKPATHDCTEAPGTQAAEQRAIEQGGQHDSSGNQGPEGLAGFKGPRPRGNIRLHLGARQGQQCRAEPPAHDPNKGQHGDRRKGQLTQPGALQPEGYRQQHHRPAAEGRSQPTTAQDRQHQPERHRHQQGKGGGVHQPDQGSQKLGKPILVGELGPFAGHGLGELVRCLGTDLPPLRWRRQRSGNQTSRAKQVCRSPAPCWIGARPARSRSSLPCLSCLSRFHS